MKPKDIWTRASASNNQMILFVILLIALLSGLARAEDIPFDTNVPDNTNTTPPARTAAPPADTATAPTATGAAADDLNNLDKLEVPTPTQNPTPTARSLPGRVKAPAELSGLGNLAPFNDIAVISRRFLPKTHRFEVFPNFGLILNDAFFNDIVLGGRFGYYFTENYGVELLAVAISTTTKSVTDEMKQQRFISTASLATPTSFYGMDFKWAPIYGKLGLMNKKIVPFDMYFDVGAGVTGTNQNTSPPTLHLSTGQIFAISKWMAGRWDLSWFIYNTTSTVTSTTGTPNGSSSGTFTNLHFTIGMSFFFPEAEYR